MRFAIALNLFNHLLDFCLVLDPSPDKRLAYLGIDLLMTGIFKEQIVSPVNKSHCFAGLSKFWRNKGVSIRVLVLENSYSKYQDQRSL